MKKKLLSLLLACSLGLTLTACGGKDAPVQEPEPSAPPSTPEAGVETAPQPDAPPAPTGGLPADASFEVVTSGSYSDGMAVIRFREPSGHSYLGLMDKAGTVQYCYDLGTSSGSPEFTAFEDGIGYVVYNSTLYEIGTDGAVRRSFPYLEMPYVATLEAEPGVEYAFAYGGGYIITLGVESGFEGTTASYSIYDPQGGKTPLSLDGNVMETIYLGKGYFRFNVDITKLEVFSRFPLWENIYCAKTGKWLVEQEAFGTRSMDSYNIVCFDDYTVFRFNILNSDSDSEHRFCAIDKDGNTYELERPSGQRISLLGAKDGLLALVSDATFYLEDIASGTLTPYTGKYADSVNSNHMQGQFQCIYDDQIGVPLTGQDGKQYVVFLDKNMSELTEPVLMALPIKFDGGYILSGGAVYDLDHNAVYTGKIKDAADGVLRVSDNAEYVQYDGTALFEEIDYSQAKMIELPQAQE